MKLSPVCEFPLDLCDGASSLTVNQNLINLLMCYSACLDTLLFL